MTNNLLPVLVTTNAVECACGEAECFFCEPFAGLTDEEAYDLYYSCPKCDALASEDHEEWCRYGQFCESAAEWDHDWSPEGVCRECGMGG